VFSFTVFQAENNLVSLLVDNNITIAMSQGIASPVADGSVIDDIPGAGAAAGEGDLLSGSFDGDSPRHQGPAGAGGDGSSSSQTDDGSPSPKRRILSVADNLKRLKEADVRIVLGTFNESWAIQVRIISKK
jgi:hypothetical protein